MEKLLKDSSELIIKVAKLLKAQYVPATRAITKEEMFAQFGDANDFSGTEIRKGLLAIAPDIKWSYAEFEIEKQNSADIKGRYWVCDAIDGAIHFLQDYYPWCITLTLMEDQQALMTIIYDAEREELFTAIRGKGAFLNGKAIGVNHKESLSEAIVATNHPNNIPEETALVHKTMESVNRIMPQVFAFRLGGPAALQLAYVAAGRVDAFWEYGNDIYDWLAGVLLIQEAGGKARIDSSGIIAANSFLFMKLEKEL